VPEIRVNHLQHKWRKGEAIAKTRAAIRKRQDLRPMSIRPEDPPKGGFFRRFPRILDNLLLSIVDFRVGGL
jgi:hypothetical protein